MASSRQQGERTNGVLRRVARAAVDPCRVNAARRVKALAAAAAPPLLYLLVPALATASTTAPFCARQNHSRSMARAGGALTVSPEPGTIDATASTQISLLGVPARKLSDVTVVGASTGPHTGKLEPYSQGDGASFVPEEPFAEGEQVTVKLRLHKDKHVQDVGWRFSIGYKGGLGGEDYKHPHQTGHAPPTQHFLSQPELTPPTFDITADAHDRSPGYLFMSPFSVEPGQAGPMIIDDSGNLVWFHPVNVGPYPATKATNLQLQEYEGKPVLTWWEDPLQPDGSGRREPQDVIYNSSYKRIATVHAGNGLVPDVHEFRLTPQGTALIAIKHDVSCDLAGVHGDPNGSAWDGVIQEVDVKTGLVRWEWNSLDHISLQEAYDSAHAASSTYPYDFFHLNSIEAINRASLLISARNTWAMYNINRQTGLVRWRLGGKRSSFKMGRGTRTAWQHDARLVRFLGHHKLEISVFDNGATPTEHKQSRALFEQVDVNNHTTQLLHAYTNTPRLLAGSQGSVQTISNGSIVVGWGQQPWVTEYNSAGHIVFDAHLPPIEQSYRALRYTWRGTPETPPAVAVTRTSSGGLDVYASWNGATSVAKWRVLEGTAAAYMGAVAEASKAGFETKIAAPASGPLVEVQALNAKGRVIGTSAPASV